MKFLVMSIFAYFTKLLSTKEFCCLEGSHEDKKKARCLKLIGIQVSSVGKK